MTGIADMLPNEQAPQNPGGAGCDMARLQALPIREEHKQALAQFCSNPENASQCQLLCDTSDEQIVQGINQIEQQIKGEIDQAQAGQPSELVQGMMQADPEMGGALQQLLQSPEAAELSQMKGAEMTGQAGGIAGQVPPGVAPSQMSEVPEPMDMPQAPRGYARGGLATLGRHGDNEQAHVSKGEMVVPNSVLRQPGLREEVRGLMQDAGTNPDRYTVGNRRMSINPQTGQPEFFAFLGLLGSVIGSSMAGAGATLMTTMLYTGLGAMAGTFLETGDFGASLKAGLMSGVGAGVMQGVSGAFAGGAPTGAAGEVVASGVAPTTAGSAWDSFNLTDMMDPSTLGSSLPASVGLTGSNVGTGALLQAPVSSTASAAVSAGAGDPGWFQQMMGSNPPANAAAPVDAAGWDVFDSFKHGVTETPYTPNSLTGIEKAAYWAGDNPIPTALGIGVLGASMMGEEEEAPDSLDHYQSPVDKYNVCMRDSNNDSAKCESLRTWAATPMTQMPAGIGGQTNTEAGRTYNNPDIYMPPVQPTAPQGQYRYGYAQGGEVRGSTDTIPAYLTEGEFVMTDQAVRGAGGGNRQRGAQRLYQLMGQLEGRS